MTDGQAKVLIRLAHQGLCTQIANLGASDAGHPVQQSVGIWMAGEPRRSAGRATDPHPPLCHPHPTPRRLDRGGTPPGLSCIPVCPTPFRVSETPVCGLGPKFETDLTHNGVGGVCYGA